MRQNHLSAEFQLILLLCQKYLDGESFDNSSLFKHLEEADIDWNRFCFLVGEHRVISLVYDSLPAFKRQVPEETVKVLRLQRETTILRNFNNLKEIRNIQNAFDQQNVDVLFIKGLVFSEELYGDATFRHTKDIDVVVRESDLDKSIQLMIELGFSSKENSIPNAELKSCEKHLVFYKPEGNACVELHWKIFNERIRSHLFDADRIDRIFSNPRILEISGVNIKTLQIEDQFIHMLHHGTNHEWGRLLRLVDFVKALNMFKENSDALRLLIKNDDLVRSFSLVMHLIHRAFSWKDNEMEEIVISSQFLKICSKIIYDSEFEIGIDRYNASFLRKLVRKNQKMFLQWNTSCGTRSKTQLVNQSFSCANDHRLLPLPETLHFLYLFLHPFFALYRHISKKTMW